MLSSLLATPLRPWARGAIIVAVGALIVLEVIWAAAAAVAATSP